MNVPVLVVGGVMKLPPEANGAIVIGGSNATIRIFNAVLAVFILLE